MLNIFFVNCLTIISFYISYLLLFSNIYLTQIIYSSVFVKILHSYLLQSLLTVKNIFKEPQNIKLSRKKI